MVTSARLTWRVRSDESQSQAGIFSERDVRELAHQDSTIYFLPKCLSVELALLTCIILIGI